MPSPSVRNALLGARGWPPPWTPDRAPGLAIWLRRGVGLAGSPVSSWADSSGSGLVTGRAAVQATGANQPALDTLDGAACPLFAGSHWLDAPLGTPLAQPYTVFVCVALTSAAGSQVIYDGQGSTNRGLLWINTGAGDVVGSTVGAWAGGSTSVSNQATDSTAALDTQTRVYAAEYNGASSKIYQNGVRVQANVTGTQSCGGLRVGAEATVAAFPLNGRVREIGVYSRALSAAEHATLATYLRAGTAAPAGPGCAVVTGTDPANSQPYTILVPNGTINGLILYSHGYGEVETYVRVDPLKAEVVSALVNAGYILAGSNQGGMTWGNQANQDALTSLRAIVAASYSFPRTMVLAQSMGGVGGLDLLLAQSWCLGWYGIFPCCSLAANYGVGGLFTTDIKSAYGIASDGSDYAAKTAGFDPCLASASAFAGKRLRCTASYADGTVARAANADALAALCAGTAAEMTVLDRTGVHGDPSHFLAVDDFVKFFDRC